MMLVRDRHKHPEWKSFQRFFDKLMIDGTNTCFERDILRKHKIEMWLSWVAGFGEALEQVAQSVKKGGVID